MMAMVYNIAVPTPGVPAVVSIAQFPTGVVPSTFDPFLAVAVEVCKIEAVVGSEVDC